MASASASASSSSASASSSSWLWYGLYLIFIVSVIIMIIVVRFNAAAKRIPGVRGPKGSFFWGNTSDFISNWNYRNQWLISLMREYGDYWQLSVPGIPTELFVTDPKSFEYIFKTNFDNFPKGHQFTHSLVDLLGDGIFNSDGANWRTQRKTASHIFTMRALRDSMTNTFVEHSNVLMKHFHSKLQPIAAFPSVDSSSSSTPQQQHGLCLATTRSFSIDIFDCFERFTLDSIGRIAFGVDLHCLQFHDEVPFAQAFDCAQRSINWRFVDATWPIKKMLGISYERDMTRSLRTINAFTKQVIAERRKLTAEQLSSETDLLSQFMSMGRDEDGTEFGDEYLRNVILNFTMAGRDTTAQALTWAVHFLASPKHAPLQQRLCDEIDKAFGRGAINYNVVSTLQFLDAVVHETLRLKPSVPIELKHAIADDVLPNGARVKAGVAVVPLLQASMRRTDVWGDDADEFNPDRWTTAAAQGRTFSEYEFCAFQAGPRTCLGKQMALLEVKVMLATLFQQWHVALTPGQKIEEETALTLPSRFPLLVDLTPRH